MRDAAFAKTLMADETEIELLLPEGSPIWDHKAISPGPDDGPSVNTNHGFWNRFATVCVAAKAFLLFPAKRSASHPSAAIRSQRPDIGQLLQVELQTQRIADASPQNCDPSNADRPPVLDQEILSGFQAEQEMINMKRRPEAAQ